MRPHEQGAQAYDYSAFSRIVVAAVAILGLLVLGAVAGCDESSDSEMTASGTSGGERVSATKGPRGPLSADGIGPVQQGDSAEAVRKLFGQPDRANRTSGCELNPDADALLQFQYALPAGDVWISFERSSGDLVSYRSESENLSTARGNRVGHSFESLRSDWGGALRMLEGLGPSTPEDGYWFVEGAPRSRLLFGIQDGQITAISGGFLQPCD